ncbi:Acetate CoA-transferase subunit alpha [Yersinia frederiksenii]|uniref:Acetate CoA-transferase subunit alpha n=2 Tax=Yersinia frederiksenii TaxID=29484 RepID=A0A380Q1R0_YERFR|nr:acetate CoA-transferase subunit alpha [Yersinia frederiksenii]KGA48144.1 acetate CoA-transferase subunit alpha [Yersinia frederiksenii ATCC 33641]MDN0119824.1 acetate CoA-transferase subunit alpha [Yersinia frederiksenii]CNF04786.1 Acetate CoA-transferase subunit alpha [Yersinia frederiksenii]SUP79197.1 Acetate CoA-transferase subunit alpha [Yersinia frederiksenii]
MKNKNLDAVQFRALLHDGMSIMFGGFMGIGTPEHLVAEIIKSGVKDLVLIGNDTGFIDTGVGPLIANGQVKKVIASHIGTNPETGKKMISGELEVVLVPQGTLVEQIRAGGAGLGGFLTPTGVGTVVEEGKQVLTLDGIVYLLERPLRADLAILEAGLADQQGNLIYHLTARNFNPLMALAADTVVAQIDTIVSVGELNPENIVTPGALVDHLYVGVSA